MQINHGMNAFDADTPPQGEIVIYQTEDGNNRIEVRFVDETVWLTQQQMAELFQTSRTNVVEHIRNIYSEGELEESATCRKFRQVREEGGRQVSRDLPHYNLDMIISLGYRVKSLIATRFRRWATERQSSRSRSSPQSNAPISKASEPSPASPSARPALAENDRVGAAAMPNAEC